MSTTIEQQVVEMRFDNRNFQQNIAETMSALEKFKQKLRLDGATRGLEDINKATKGVDMSGLGKTVDAVSMKFSALQVMGVTALANITNSAVNAGKRMISALTIDPIKTGFQEYETQMNAVQTILANTSSKGSTLEDVNSALDELNTYADKTIYNFTEMTRNIGTFTAAGVDLDTSVNAIQGIANLAAVSGSNSQQASTAMYQLSQALAAGKVQLMDWNSVVNAGMGGEMFQNALRETSELLGTGAEAAIKAKGSFRESLKEGWLTSEVLTETLKKFTTSGANEYVAEYTGLSKEAVQAALDEAEARYGEADAIEKAAQALAEKSGKNKDEIKTALQFAKTAEDAATKVKTFSQLWDVMKESAQSGWAQTWKLIVGDFEQAKALLTPLADFLTGVIGKFSDARNELLKGALGKTFSHLSKTIDKVLGPARKIGETMGKVSDAAGKASDVIGDVTGSLDGLSEIINKVIRGNFGNGQERIESLTKAGYNYYRIQNKVNETLGNSFRYTDEQIAAQDKLLKTQPKVTDAKKEDAKATADLTDADKKLIAEFAAMSDAELAAIGFTKEQIAAFRELRETAEKLGIPLDEFIKNMDQIDGRWLLWNSFKNIGLSIVDVFKAIGKAYRDVFPPMKADQLFDIIAGFHKFSTLLRPSEDTLNDLTRTFRGLFAAIDIILTVIGGPFKLAFKVISKLLGQFDVNILDATAVLGDLIVKFRNFLFENDLVNKAIEKLAHYIGVAINKLREFIKQVRDSETFQKFADAMKNAFGYIKTDGLEKLVYYAGRVISKIKELVKAFMELPMVQKAIAGLKNTLKSAVELGTNLIDGLINGLKGGSSSVFDTIIEFGKNILNWFKSILGIHSPSTETEEMGKNLIEGFINGFKNALTWLKNAITDVGSTIINGFTTILSKIDFGKLYAGIVSGGLVYALVKIGKLFESFTNPLDGLGDIFENVAGVIKSFSGVLKSFSAKVKAQALKELAIGIAILVGSLIALTFVDGDKLNNALKTILIIMGAIGTLYGIIEGIGILSSKFGSSDKGIGGIKETIKSFAEIAKLSSLVLAIGTSMLLLAGAAKILSSIDGDGISKAITFMGSFMLFVGLLVTTASMYPVEKIEEVSNLIRKISTSILLLSLAAKLIATMSWGDMGKAGAFVLGLTTLVAGLVFLTSKYPPKRLDSVSALVGKLASTFLLLAIAAKIIAGMTWGDMGKAAVGIAGLSIIIGLLIKSLGRNADAKNFNTLGGTLMAIAGCFAILAITAKIIAGMTWGDMGKAGAGIAGLSIIIALLIKSISKNANAKDLAKVGSTLLMASIAIGILAGVSVLLGLIDLPTLAKGVGAVAIFGVIMAGMIKATQGANDVKGNIMMMAIAIGVMAASIGILSLLDQEAVRSAALSMGMVMGVFALILKASQSATKSVGPLIVMTVVIGLLGGLLWLLSGLPVTSALAVSFSLSLMIAALAGSLFLLGNIQGPTTKALISAGVMTLVMGAMAGILLLLQGLPVASALASAASLSIMILAMSASLLLLSGLQSVATKALIAIGVMTLVAIALGAMAAALGAFDGMSWSSVGMGLTVLAGAFLILGVAAYALAPVSPVVLALGGAIALLGAGCLMAGTGVLAFTTALTQLAVMGPAGALAIQTVVMTLIALIPMVAAAIGQGIVAFAGAIASGATTICMAITTVILAITAALTASIPAIVNCIHVMLTSFLNFIVSFVPEVVVAGVKLIIGLLEGIAQNLPKIIAAATEVIAQFLIGIGRAVPRVVDAGFKMIIEFLNGMADAVRGNTDTLISAVNNLMDACITAIGKWFKNVAKNMMDGFLKGIGEKFGAIKQKAIDAVSGAVGAVKKFLGGFTGEGFALGMANCFNLIRDTAAKLGAKAIEGVQDELDINSPSKVAKDKVGKYFVQGIAEGIDEDMSAEEAAAKKAQNIVDAFQTEFNKLDTDVSTADLEYELWSKTAGIDATEEEANAVELDRLIKNFNIQKERVALAQGEYDVTLKEFGKTSEETQEAYNKLLQQRINLADLSSQITELQKSMTSSSNTAETFDAYANWMKENKSKLEAYGMSLAQIKAAAQQATGYNPFDLGYGTDETIAKTEEAVMSLGETYSEAMNTGVQNTTDQALATTSKLVQTCADNIKALQPEWVTSGTYLVEGFIKGIDDKIQEAADKAAEMAKAAYLAALAALGINSPSKAFAEIGMYADLGFAKGLTDYADTAADASAEMATGALSGLKTMVGRLTDSIGDEVGAHATITPILDLSNVQNGVTQLRGLFAHKSAELAASASVAVNSSSNMYDYIDQMQKINDRRDSEIVGALGELRGDFGNLINAISNLGIQLDDGTMVGKIINKIDNGLGRIAQHKGRGN